jgi:hypothetical protein
MYHWKVAGQVEECDVLLTGDHGDSFSLLTARKGCPTAFSFASYDVSTKLFRKFKMSDNFFCETASRNLAV